MWAKMQMICFTNKLVLNPYLHTRLLKRYSGRVFLRKKTYYHHNLLLRDKLQNRHWQRKNHRCLCIKKSLTFTEWIAHLHNLLVILWRACLCVCTATGCSSTTSYWKAHLVSFITTLQKIHCLKVLGKQQRHRLIARYRLASLYKSK